MKKNYKITLVFILGILVSCTSVYAARKYLSSDVTYKNTTVENALNDLYSKSSSTCDKSMIGATWNFNYSGEEAKFVIPCNGIYKLETWGAQGGTYNAKYYGGYGAYAVGNIELSSSTNIYINIGGQGSISSKSNYTTGGGYNGGGAGHIYNCSPGYIYGGGGATHISKTTGLLSSLENNKESILIVSSGGAGAYYCDSGKHHAGNHGGGIVGVGDSSYIGTQTTGVFFGKAGGYNTALQVNYSGGGGGFYGGRGYWDGLAGGGSSYIGNTLLKDKVMYCYNCTESNEESTKTISTTNTSDQPVSGYVKKGNGYAKITLVSLK